MIKGKLSISNQDFAIRQVGASYSNIGAAFKEYTTNAVDAIYDGNITNGRINVIVNKEEGWLFVQDNGIGMTYEKLKSLPHEIFDSSRKHSLQNIGEKGVGNLSFLQFAENLTFLSRGMNHDSDLVNVLRVDAHSLGYEIYSTKPENLDLSDMVKRIIISEMSHGTVVYIPEIDPKIMDKYFSPSKLESLISETYTPILKQGRMEIKIGYLGKKGKVKLYEPEPLKFDGEIVLEDVLEVKDVKLKDGSTGIGNIHLFITINPQSNDKRVRVYHKGVKVNNSITGIEFLDKEPWNLGKLEGFIDDDFLKLNLPRNSFEFNQNYKLWLPRIEEIGDYLNVEMKKYRSKRDRTNYEIADKVLRAIDVIYRQLDLREFFSKKRSVKKTAVKEETEEDEKPTVEIPIKTNGQKETRLTIPFKPDFISFDLGERHLRSRLVGRFIKVNTNHQDFQKYYEGKEESEGADYLLDLFSKEIAFAAAKSLLTRDEEERPSIDDIILKTKEIANDIYYNSQRQLKINIGRRV